MFDPIAYLYHLYTTDPVAAAFIMDRYHELALSTTTLAQIEAALVQACQEYAADRQHDPAQPPL